MIFTLRSAQDLDKLRDALQTVPFEEAGSRSAVRAFAVIDDADYVSAMQGMQRQIRYMNALFLCLYAAVMLIGTAGAYLLQNSRKPEIALMRALGVGSARITITFLLEHLILSGIGTAAGALCFLAASGGVNATFLSLIAAYKLCWMAGSGIRISKALRQKAQEFLAEPE